MGAMKRVVLVCLLAVAAFTVSAAPSSAGVSCRDRVINDWEHDGKIATTYPLHCYRDAIKYAQHSADITTYSTLLDDLRAALAAAVARKHGHHVAAEVGHGLKAILAKYSHTNRLHGGSGNRSHTSTLAIGPTGAHGNNGGGGSGVPVPLIVLGSIAVLLAASGAAGLLVKRRRGPSV
jgi:hypothetical protein